MPGVLPRLPHMAKPMDTGLAFGKRGPADPNAGSPPPATHSTSTPTRTHHSLRLGDGRPQFASTCTLTDAAAIIITRAARSEVCLAFRPPSISVFGRENSHLFLQENGLERWFCAEGGRQMVDLR